MFGDEIMLFQTKVKIDVKGRMSIPSKTNVEEKEKLILIGNDDYISIFSLDVIKNRIKLLANSKIDAISNGDVELIKYLDNELRLISTSSLDTYSVDKYHRILLSSKLRNLYNFTNEVFIQGEINHINVFKDEETFENYKIKIKERS